VVVGTAYIDGSLRPGDTHLAGSADSGYHRREGSRGSDTAMPVYDRPVKILMKEFIERNGINPGQPFTRQSALQWFAENYPKVRPGTVNAHLDSMSTNFESRKHHINVKAGSGRDLFFKLGRSEYRLYDPERDPALIYRETSSLPADIEESANDEDYESEKRAFAFERDLQNYLAKNLRDLEEGLRLYEEEGISGIEYPAGGRSIDILAVGKENHLVVVELKVSRGYDRVIGQLLRYIAWVKNNVADPDQGVRGIIVAREITEDLRLAVSLIKDVKLVEYELSLSFRGVSP
jgi:hypothetical protein